MDVTDAGRCWLAWGSLDPSLPVGTPGRPRPCPQSAAANRPTLLLLLPPAALPDLLADAMVHLATTPACANQASVRAGLQGEGQRRQRSTAAAAAGAASALCSQPSWPHTASDPTCLPASLPAPSAQAFNISNGDCFRWKDMWPAMAAWFQLPTAPPIHMPMVKARGCV